MGRDMCVCAGVGGGRKAINIQWTGERRKEGKGELRMVFCLCVLCPLCLYRSTSCLFILFICLSFSFSPQSPKHLVGTPPFSPSHHKATALNCSFSS